MGKYGLALVSLLMVFGCDQRPASDTETESRAASDQEQKSTHTEEISSGVINPANWPKQESPLERDPAIETRIAELLARMTLEEKVGQVIQADIGSVTPDEVREYNLGSVLNGGNSAPNNDVRIGPDAWLSLADEFWDASTDTSDGGLGIPVLWGTDAVHGHNNIVGATVFPAQYWSGGCKQP